MEFINEILASPVTQFVYFVVALLLSLSFHEASHAFVAYYLGDPTAKIKGRLTLNPVAHLDPVGTIMLLVTRVVGWGKPVPVNPANFKQPVRDNALTALAGPMSNFVLAFVMALILRFLGGVLPLFVTTLLWMMFHLNIYLGIFNLFPLPPLDGSKILGLLIPEKWYGGYAKFLQNGVKYFIVIILIDALVLPKLLGVSFIGLWMRNLHGAVAMIMLLGT